MRCLAPVGETRMTEEKLVERVTALFADSDAAQRKMIRLYAETNDAIEASAIIDSGAEVLHMLQGGRKFWCWIRF